MNRFISKGRRYKRIVRRYKRIIRRYQHNTQRAVRLANRWHMRQKHKNNIIKKAQNHTKILYQILIAYRKYKKNISRFRQIFKKKRKQVKKIRYYIRRYRSKTRRYMYRIFRTKRQLRKIKRLCLRKRNRHKCSYRARILTLRIKKQRYRYLKTNKILVTTVRNFKLGTRAIKNC